MQKVLLQHQKKKGKESRQYLRSNKKQRRNEQVNEKLREFLALKSVSQEVKIRLSHQIASYQLVLVDFINKIEIRMTILVTIVIILFFYFFSDLINPLLSNIFLKTFKMYFANFSSAILLTTLSTLLSLLIVLLPLLFISIYFLSVMNRLFYHWMKIQHTLPVIVDNLTSLLLSVEKEPDGSMSMQFKRAQVLKLEETATCIEHYLPRWFRTGNFVTDAWMEERFRQIAAALREKEKWILTPKEDTHDYFIKSIASTLICFVEGNWDALEGIAPETLTRPQTRNFIPRLLQSALKTLLLAALPVAGFFVYQQTPLALTGSAFDTMVTILSIYAVTVVTSALDPGFSNTVSTVSEVSNFLPKTGRKA